MSDKTATRKQAPIKRDLLKKLDSLQSSISTRRLRLSADLETAKMALHHLTVFVSCDSELGVNHDTLNLVQSVILRYEKLASKG